MSCAPALISGMLPAPIASSRSRGWSGVLIERYRTQGSNPEFVSAAVLVTVHLGRPVFSMNARGTRSARPRLSRGDITIVPARYATRWHFCGEADFLALWLDPTLIEQVASQIAGQRCDTEILECFGVPDPQIERIARTLYAELALEEFGSKVYGESLANQLVVHLLRRHTSASDGSRPGHGVLPGFKLRDVTAFMNEHLADELRLSSIAQKAGMSPHHFARAFKRSTGLAPHQYLITRRIEAAKTLLWETDLPIIEIAQRVGCSNQSHFSTLFHRVVALSPREFRLRRHQPETPARFRLL